MALLVDTCGFEYVAINETRQVHHMLPVKSLQQRLELICEYKVTERFDIITGAGEHIEPHSFINQSAAFSWSILQYVCG
jgi:hypothetical protein